MVYNPIDNIQVHLNPFSTAAGLTANRYGSSIESGSLTPEQRLDPPNMRLINAGIVTIHKDHGVRVFSW